jgi:dTMP kinase
MTQREAPRPPRGGFIVMEGIDGSGSTTQAQRLVAALERAGVPALFTCEPSSGHVGALIREALGHRLRDRTGASVTLDWVTLALLFAADRADHVHRTVLPALEQGQWVVSDRYDLSSLAYQSVTSGAAAGAVPWIVALNSKMLRPDLTIVVDVTAATAARRRHARGSDAELFEVPELQERLASVYRDAETLVPDDRLIHVDGEQDIERVASEIWTGVQAALLAAVR